MKNYIELSEEEIVDIYEENSDLYNLISKEEWIDRGKFDTKEIIFQDLNTKKCYRAEIKRYGSYHEGYDFGCYDTECIEVKEIKKIIEIKEWVEVEE